MIYSESQSPGVLVTHPKSFTFRPSLVRYLEMVPGIEAQEGRKENNLNDDNVIRTLSADRQQEPFRRRVRARAEKYLHQEG